MNFNIEVRKKQLESLNQYINSSKDKVETVLGYLGWNAKKVLQIPEKTVCPLNKGHVVPLENVVKHVQTCRVVTAGYSLDDPQLPDVVGDQRSCITLDQTKKIEILNEARSANSKFKAAWNGHDPDPLTADRIVATYSADERVTFYDYAIKHTKGPPVPPEFDININDSSKKEEKELTYEERLEQERNAKRRRAKYKSVHTGRNKSYTEVMREVIGNQMELYEEYLIKQEEKINIERSKALYDDTENILENPSDQTFLYSDNNFSTNEYSQQQVKEEIQYYDDQYEKYIPTDYFSNIQNCQSLANKGYSYNLDNYGQTPSTQVDPSNYYNSAIYENLTKQTTIPTTHNTPSENPVGTDYILKLSQEIQFSDTTYVSEKHYSKRYNSERKETHRRDNYRRYSPEISDRDHRKHHDYSRRCDRSSERYKDENKGSSRERYRDSRGEDRKYSHDSRRSRDRYRSERR